MAVRQSYFLLACRHATLLISPDFVALEAKLCPIRLGCRLVLLVGTAACPPAWGRTLVTLVRCTTECITFVEVGILLVARLVSIC